MIALLIFIGLIGVGVWNLFGAVAAFGSAGMWALAAIIAMVMGPKYPWKKTIRDKDVRT